MHEKTVNRLLTLNKEFYQSFAEPFSESRNRVQPGVLSAINTLPEDATLFDVGCGNGELASKLHVLGHIGTYLGLDSSIELLNVAKEKNTHPNAQFVHGDISSPDWSANFPGRFDRVFSFATMHHIPGNGLREKIFRSFHPLLEPDGFLVFSVWNFLASSRLRNRIVPWETVQIDPSELDQNDYLLDWRRGGYGLRYVHAFKPEELAKIAEKTGFKVIDVYFSDGEGGKLGNYYVWQPV